MSPRSALRPSAPDPQAGLRLRLRVVGKAVAWLSLTCEFFWGRMRLESLPTLPFCICRAYDVRQAACVAGDDITCIVVDINGGSRAAEQENASQQAGCGCFFLSRQRA